LIHVFFGGEDVGSYAENFVRTLRSGGWLVAGVNACDAKKNNGQTTRSKTVHYLPEHAQVRHIKKSATLSWQCAFY